MVLIDAQQWTLNRYATFAEEVNLNYDSPDATFKLTTKTYDTEDPELLKDGEILLETLYLSNDPAQKGWFTSRKSYVPPVPLGSVAPSQGIGRVIVSKSDDYSPGDIIYSRKVGWSTHNVISPTPLDRKLDASKVPHITKYLSAFGTTTLTAYFSAFKYSELKPDDEGKIWLISGAAGAAGSSLVQIVAHLFKPKKIIAIAGGESKRKWVETLGVNGNVIGVDYKSDDYNDKFEEALNGEEIDVFVDHTFGKIVQVGSIASYNDNTNFVFNSFFTVTTKRLRIQGMIVIDDIDDFPEAFTNLTEWFSNGKLDISKFEETVVDGKGVHFKDVPKLWTGLFTGQNKGKYITQVGDY
ncbi:putative NADP-dependent oxidoreductase YfmJ [Cyberlindnera fabianii]|uniref:Putative NADP-dependent oxidoreductase YfmJ n=1 Tax=Cyberlindnera fabianii TaxID=36022 RepID=A0A1V2LAB0_CYBFA|nr:putative NADP-dependent oxidoreductase YfmJ [Cyberlindnera fabianii]